MEKLHILPTNSTPEVVLNPQTGEFSIIGTSYSNHSVEFYDPILTFFNEYGEQPAPDSILTLKLAHRNSSTDKCIIQILEGLCKTKSENSKLTVKWYYSSDDDDDELDYAKSLSLSLKATFEFIPY